MRIRSKLNQLERILSIKEGGGMELTPGRQSFARAFDLMSREGDRAERLISDEQAFLSEYKAEHPDKIEIINDYLSLFDELGEAMGEADVTELDEVLDWYEYVTNKAE